MAGAGYKEFTTGDVLTASDLNTYGIEQTVMVFASSSARDTALTSVKAEGMFAFLKDTDSLTYYSGAAWVAVDLAGDITGITTAANSGMAGGATSGTASISVDASNLTSATGTTADYVIIQDVDDSDATKRCLISDFVAAGDITSVVAGTNLSGGATSGAATLNLAIDAAVEFGSDGSGVDVTLFSDTAGDKCVWDSSAESLTITGTDGQDALIVDDGNLSVTDTATIGTLTLDSAPATAWTDSNIVLAGQVFSG